MTANLEVANPQMHEPLSTVRQLELLRDLQRLANERAQEEERIRTALSEGLDEATATRDKAAREIEQQNSEHRALATAEFEKDTADTRRQYEQQRDAAQHSYKGLRQGVESEHSRVTEAALAEQQQASWETQAVFEAIQGRPKERFLATVKLLERSSRELAVLEHDVTTVMKLRHQWREFRPLEDGEVSSTEADAPAGNKKAHRVQLGRMPESNAIPSRGWATGGDPVELAVARVNELTGTVRSEAETLVNQKLPRLFEGGNPFGAFALVWLVAIILSGIVFGWHGWNWLAASLVLAGLVYGGLAAWLWPKARRGSGEQFQEVRQRLAAAREAIEAALEEARQRGRRESQSLVADRDQQLAAADEKLATVVSTKERWKETEISRAGQTFPQGLARLRETLETSLAEIKQKHDAALARATETRDGRAADNEQQYQERCRVLRAEHDRAWETLRGRWFAGLAMLRDAWEGMNTECQRLFPDWDTTDYTTWPQPIEVPTAFRFGEVTLELANVKHGIPRDERLRPAETRILLPALMTLDEHPVLVVTAEEEGRRQAIDVLQLAMLRMLTAMPAGKVRFTILDPVGLGENFASFMHLADYDEQLIASRIWTDSKQIEDQLTRLTAHMETVLQKYLRNEFATIAEYNERAGEVAEPFQVLVVANFPANCSESAARKLVSIATSGPRCGVYTILSVDRKQRLPNDFELNDLLANAVHLDWQPREQRFRWRYPAFEHMTLLLDRPPSAERFNEVVRAAGRAAKDSMKVEVPFEVVAPAENEYWSQNSGRELIVPIGRAGAMRLQSIQLGRGTSQHVLICGKTGSGKSTLLHALITNTALHYSPDEVEFYLIDFKKGVEFKTYATHHLPHARVIAIESEREFGMSVLERLDAELHRRGDLFRAAGVQDVPDFRAARPNEPMPRVLLVVDEFQELFVEDDKLSQDAALLLDRLVRQGRAFGIHVLLGSQTLSGAYSLARSTMGQMAVRVALQCSEADAHLILSDERNMAARFLSRPGEAIYNDQNGLLAGNHPFQVVWLPEAKRIEYLRKIEARSEEQGAGSNETIVFEGDQPADPADNVQLREVLQRGPNASPSAPQKAWLGAAVAIKEPTAAVFARHAGSNLLVVGTWEESALGVLTNAVVALAAQNLVGDFGVERAGRFSTPAETDHDRAPHSAPRTPQFYVLDGTRPESAEAGTWQRIADALPHKIDVAGSRDTARVIGEIAAELARREAASEEDARSVYLIIFNGGRFRDLRRSEDDFSFSMDSDKKANPGREWAEILRNGPAWGIHTLLWCDSYNNVSRLLDRMMLREFEMRVAFQMSAADSSSLLDTPAATRLRQHRGLFASEDLGTLEKFRPYGRPTNEWFDEARRAMQKGDETRKSP